MPRARSVRLLLVIYAEPGAPLPLGDVGLFLYDFATLYELIRLGLDPAYVDYRFGKYPLYRGRRPLEPKDQPSLEHIEQGSALIVKALAASERSEANILAAVGRTLAHWLESIYPDALDRPQVDREIGKLERQSARNQSGKSQPRLPPVEALARLEERGAESHIQTVLRRLARSQVKITRLDIQARTNG